VQDTALIPARPAVRLVFQHHARGRPGPEIVVGQLQARPRRSVGKVAAAEAPAAGFQPGRGRSRLRTGQGMTLEILDRGIQRHRQTALDIGPKQAGPPSGLIEAPALAGHAQPRPGLGLTQSPLAAKGGQGLAQTAGSRIGFEARHRTDMPSSPRRGEDENVSQDHGYRR